MRGEGKGLSSERIALRREREEDYRAVEVLTRQAFWNKYGPGCDEHYLAHIMRASGAFVAELDYVAEENGAIVGNIMYTEATLDCDDGRVLPVLSFGPVSVLPGRQGRGIGGRLIVHTLALARALGYKAVLIMGDPDYYSRFGFAPAEGCGIATGDDRYADALLALELEEGALSSAAGRLRESEIYQIDSAAAAAFDEKFPPLERKTGLPSQARFQELAGRQRPRQANEKEAFR